MLSLTILTFPHLNVEPFFQLILLLPYKPYRIHIKVHMAFSTPYLDPQCCSENPVCALCQLQLLFPLEQLLWVPSIFFKMIFVLLLPFLSNNAIILYHWAVRYKLYNPYHKTNKLIFYCMAECPFKVWVHTDYFERKNGERIFSSSNWGTYDSEQFIYSSLVKELCMFVYEVAKETCNLAQFISSLLCFMISPASLFLLTWCKTVSYTIHTDTIQPRKIHPYSCPFFWQAHYKGNVCSDLQKFHSYKNKL